MGGIDWGRAIAEGIEGGARAEQGVLVKDQDEQRWLEREKQLQAMEAEQFKNRQLFMRGIEPPQIRTTHVNKAGDDGKTTVMDRQQQWVIGEDGKGAWQDFGEDVPNVNQERLEETQRNHDLVNDAKDAARAAREREQQAQLALGYERLEHAKDRRGGEVQPKPYTFTVNGKPVIRYGTFDQSGTFTPAKDEHGQVIQGDKFRPSVFQEKREASAEGVKGTMATLAHALGLSDLGDTLSGYAPSGGRPETDNEPSAAPAPQPSPSAPARAPAAKQVVQTGSKNGRKVVKYSDGSVVYADTGQPVQ